MDKPDVDFIEGLLAGHLDRPEERRPATPGPRSARSPRSTTTCACSSPGSACRTARTTARSSPASRPQQIVDRILSCPRAPASRCWRRWCGAARAPTRPCCPTSPPGLHQGPHRRRDARPATEKARPRPLRAAHHRGGRRPPRAAGRHRAAPHRLARDGAGPGRGRRRGRARPRAEGEEVAESEKLTFSQHLACPTCGRQLRGARAPQLLVQLAVRRLRALRRPRHPLRGRPRARGAQPRALGRRGRHRRRSRAGTAHTSTGCSRRSARSRRSRPTSHGASSRRSSATSSCTARA